MRIGVRDLEKRFGEHRVLRGVSLEVRSGELLALLGPSGCGKTTLLRILAGLEFPDSGQVLFDDVDVTDHPVRARGLGFVFQHFALFRHLSVFENVAFGLRVKPRRSRPGKVEIRTRVLDLLRLVRLEPYANHLPSELSGGQRQRVALARALAVEPKVLLLDEPFGSLDAQVRRELRGWLRRLHEELNLTSILVTHDQEEALEVAGRVAVMRAGEIVQTGSPDEVYRRPADAFVYEFLGSVNRFDGVALDGAVRVGDWPVPLLGGAAPSPGRVAVFVRPHHLEVHPLPASGDGGAMGAANLRGVAPPGGFRATVRHVHAAGPFVRLEFECSWGASAAAELSHERYCEIAGACAGGGLTRGTEVWLRVAPEHLFVRPE